MRPSEGLISLGTSDVVLVSTSKYNPHPQYHAFFHPAQIGPPSVQDDDEREGCEALRYFNMLIFKSEPNPLPVGWSLTCIDGSLAREHVRDRYFDRSWDTFNAAVEEMRPKSSADLPAQAAFW